MTSIKKTGSVLHDANLQDNNSHIYISRAVDAMNPLFDWKQGTYYEAYWKEYQIKETDMRVKTATFSSPNYIDLTTGLYGVLITSTMHDDFGGIIISVDYDKSTNLYNYQCQDFSRYYQGTVELISPGKATNHRILQYLITRGSIPIQGKIKSAMKKRWKKELSGLLPAYQYNQKYFGGNKDNPMEKKFTYIIRKKSYIEAIRDLVYGSGAFIDVYFDKYGVLQVAPYHKNDLFKSGLTITTPELASAKYKFDTTNIITGVRVLNTDKTMLGKYYTSDSVLGLSLAGIFGVLDTTIDNPNQSTSSKKKTNTGSDKKKSTDTKDVGANPYNTKKKRVYINSDNIHGKSNDKKFMEDMAKLLRKQGWEVKVKGVGSNTHYNIDVKDGVWFCIYGGADAALLKEQAGPSAYKNKEKKLKSRTVIGFKKKDGATGPPCDIRKGGKCYKYLKRAHDDNYSNVSGLEYPSKKLISGKVPFMYAGTAKDMVAKFLKGGDEPKAL